MRENFYRLVTTTHDSLIDGVIVTDREGLIMRVNHAAAALTGWSAEAAKRERLTKVLELSDGDGQRYEEHLLPRALAAKDALRLPETTLLRDRAGVTRPIGATLVPVRHPDGRLLGLVAIIRDLSGERSVQREIERRERLLQSILDTLPISVMLKDAAGRYVFVNDLYCRLVGEQREDVVGKTLFDFFSGNFAVKRAEEDERVRQSGKAVVREGYAPPGTFPGYWLSGANRLDLGDDAEPLLLRYALDITDRREIEEALKASTKTLEMFFSQSLEGFFSMTLDEPVRWDQETDKERALDHLFAHLRIATINDAGLAQYGGSREQMVGRTLAQAFNHDPAYGRAIVRRIFDQGRLRSEVEERRMDNTLLWLEGDFVVLRNDDDLVTGLFGAQRDISERKIAETERLAGAERFRATFEQAAVGIGHLAQDGRWLRVNERLCGIAGRTAESLREVTLFELIHPDDRGATKQKTEPLFAGLADAITLEKRLLQPAGGTVWVALTLSVVRRIAGENLYAVAVVQDITERKHSEALLQASEERFRDVVDAAGEYIWETDAEWRLVFISNQVERMMGYRPAEVIGRQTMEFLPPGEAERMNSFFHNRQNRAAPFNSLEVEVLHSSGERLWQQISGVPVLNDDGRIVGYRGASLDIHDRKLAAKKIEQLATKDVLTGLPNRVLLYDRLEQAISGAARKGQMLGLMFIDLDRFKTINDSLGHHVGDLLLKAVAERLSGCVRRGDTLARLGGDEFIVALYDLKSAEDVTIVAGKMLSVVSNPYEIEGRWLSTGCSIGVGIYPSDGADVATLMRNADTAMYHAKEKGRNNYQFFSAEMNVRVVERLHLENELRLAVRNRQFALHYQPQVSLRDNQITGAEALVRWIDPETGRNVPPARFISIAEDTGLIVPIGEWVLRTACAQAKAWQDAGHPPLRMTVNVSVGQFRGNEALSDMIARVLTETGLEARWLELEMTESLLFHNIEENIKLLARLGEMGVRISIDDFGTGYSSLSYLKRLPVDTIKIDGSFVHDIVADENDAAIVAAIIAMARRLKLRVIAEGVETTTQLHVLRELQCDEYQGFLYSKALPADEFARQFFRQPLLLQVL